jgi:hypothetical protein
LIFNPLKSFTVGLFFLICWWVLIFSIMYLRLKLKSNKISDVS